MIADGLFEQFPCDEIYGMHNLPNGQPGKVGICKGVAMAGAAFFDIKVTGKGSHAARPSDSKDALIIAASLTTELQTILSRNVPALDACVLSVTQLHAGAAYNVIPEVATLAGTIRYFKDEVYTLAADRMQAICDGFALAHDVQITLDLRNVFDVLINDEALSDAYMDAAADIVGADNIFSKAEPATGSEDLLICSRLYQGHIVLLGMRARCRCTIRPSSLIRTSCPSVLRSWRGSSKSVCRFRYCAPCEGSHGWG